MLSEKSLSLINGLCLHLRKKFKYLPDFDPSSSNISHILYELVERLEDNDPYFHPNYMGHMSSYVHDSAILGFMLAMQINPNNHSYDGGRATTEMELECIREIADMLGFKNAQGHLTSGGTNANLEALWVARELGGNSVLASKESHFTHKRMTSVLRMHYIPVDTNKKSRICVTALDNILKATKDPSKIVVVATLGTTGSGAVDPLDEIVILRKKYGFWLHVDAAYGGYFSIVKESLSSDVYLAFDNISEVDSIVIDPHKHGLQGFGCGSVIFNKKITSVYDHNSPYTYFNETEAHIGKISLECSRPGAVAASLWATMKVLPLKKEGEFSVSLTSCLNAARCFANLIDESPFFNLLCRSPDLDIVVFYPALESSVRISETSKYIYEKARDNLIYLSLIKVNSSQLGFNDNTGVTCLRAVLMKKEHESLVSNTFTLIEKLFEEKFLT